uniref:Uncharacterized protein n=1 Tax=Arundo donax TaxID=35708 RepID=A0A0A8XRJ0_ARUDO
MFFFLTIGIIEVNQTIYQSHAYAFYRFFLQGALY